RAARTLRGADRRHGRERPGGPDRRRRGLSGGRSARARDRPRGVCTRRALRRRPLLGSAGQAHPRRNRAGEDPVVRAAVAAAAAWSARADQLYQAGTSLDALGLDALHFEGPGTDLTIGLLPTSRFSREGARARTRAGVEHMPNLPTEEVFTTPDPERTEGVVRATKPLDVGGAVVDGLRIRFEGGRAVEIDADENAE